MNTTITLDESHYRSVVEKARAIGKTPGEYLHLLIDADTHPFDELFTPTHKGFQSLNESELDELLNRVQKSLT